jgi:hypothetical protein
MVQILGQVQHASRVWNDDGDRIFLNGRRSDVCCGLYVAYMWLICGFKVSFFGSIPVPKSDAS